MRQQSHPNLNVKFAPLPQLAPRKRRSTAPLGMAARSQMVNRRRKNYPQYYQEPLPPLEPELPPPSHDPMWTEEELAEARARQLAAAEKERKKAEAKANGGKGTEEDPFLVFGKLVKGASRQLWKKVAKKDKKGQGAQEGAGDVETHDDKVPNLEKEAENEKQGNVDGQGRTDSSSSEDEVRASTDDAERADTPSSNEDTPPQVPPKEDEVRLVDQYIVPDFGQTFLPEDIHAGGDTSSPDLPEPSRASFASSTSSQKPSPAPPVPPCPSPSSTDAQYKAL
ncbi:hypothetical protein BKA70DRAFT_792112 [Coprinopsis sp. MPI-PUGE-AT-0042]|nr:hypothetical protein BKA70DRAFT_792112 [Coprinopsis sp. MPI-PUGE-AT-0042]